MSDCCCSDQCGEKFCEVRMYEYYILSVEPCRERVVYGPKSRIVTSNMSGEAFSTYAMALYCKDPKNEITEENAQYLRVCYRINCTLPKERRDCCETSGYGRDQVAVLREIRDALRGGPPPETDETTFARTETTPAPTGGGGRRGAGASA